MLLKKMTNKPKPWMLNDISQEAREIAIEGAMKDGVKIGEWVNSLILLNAYQRKTNDRLDEIRRKNYNDTFVGYKYPVSLTIGALNEDDLDKKLLLHIYNKMKENQCPKPEEHPKKNYDFVSKQWIVTSSAPWYGRLINFFLK